MSGRNVPSPGQAPPDAARTELTAGRGAAVAAARSQIATGAVFFASGASLVIHILTGAMLPAVLGALLVGGAVLVVPVASDAAARARIAPLLRAGTIAGLVSTAVYDVSRYALVAAFDLPVSPFKALPYFGNALVGAAPHSMASWIAGAAFHVLNGVCFGIGYTVLVGRRGLPGAVAFALVLEASMVAVYPRWLQIEALKEFTQMSLFGHIAYGLSLGIVTNALLPGRAVADQSTRASEASGS